MPTRIIAATVIGLLVAAAPAAAAPKKPKPKAFIVDASGTYTFAKTATGGPPQNGTFTHTIKLAWSASGIAKLTRKGKKRVVRIVNPTSTPLTGKVDSYVHTEDSGITVPKMDTSTNQWTGGYIRCTKHYQATPFTDVKLAGILTGSRVKGLRAWFQTTNAEVERESRATDDPNCLPGGFPTGRAFEAIEGDWFLPAETVHPDVIEIVKCDRPAGSFKRGYHSHCHATRSWHSGPGKAEWDADVFLLPL